MEEVWREVRAEPLTALWLAGNALGFLCLVNRERDRPQLPVPADAAAIAKPVSRPD